ncbi:MAG: DUF2817 domain-containing protein [Rhizomicrobium sp.]
MPPDPETPFPPDYRTARKAFIAACVKAHTDTISRAHMGKPGPDGKPVFIDSIALGARDAQKAVLLIANDAHASVAVTTLLREGVAVPDGMRLVVVHALDPFAFMRVPGDPAWSQAMLKAIATEDLSRVTELTVLGFGITEDEFPAIFPQGRKIRLICKFADAPIEIAQMHEIVKAKFARA